MEEDFVASLAQIIDQMASEYRNEMFKYACTLTKDIDEADELVQQAFYQTLIYLQNNPGTPIKDPKKWLRKTIRNHFLNTKRDQSHFVQNTDTLLQISLDQQTEEDGLLAIPDLSDESRPDYIVELREEEEEVRRKIVEAILHSGMQKVTEHFIIDKMNCADIAETYGIPLSTVRYEVKRGIELLKSKLLRSKQLEE